MLHTLSGSFNYHWKKTIFLVFDIDKHKYKCKSLIVWLDSDMRHYEKIKKSHPVGKIFLEEDYGSYEPI